MTTYLTGLRVSFVVAVGITCAARGADAPRPPDGVVRLFNGRNLDGWYTYVRDHGRDKDPNRVFTVRDGMIHITGQEYGCITTEKEHENYRLIAEYRWGEKAWPPRAGNARDSGILVHSFGEDGGYARIWMRSIEMQIIEGGTGDLLLVYHQGDKDSILTATVPTAPEKQAGNWVYQPGGAMRTYTLSANLGRVNWFGRDPAWKDVKGYRGRKDVEKPVGEWNRVEVIAAGDSLKYILNGVTVNEAFKVRPHRGRIQIQSEGAEIHFRRVDLIPIATTQPAGR